MVNEWRPYEPSRDAEHAARKHRPIHPEDCVCGGEGWLWGHELKHPPEQVTDTRYRCDQGGDET